jgi:Xaa-Pro aminopeptidase
MDLHDTPLVSKDAALREGQVLTIEPGCVSLSFRSGEGSSTSDDHLPLPSCRVYIPYDSRFPAKFHGMGIRIEVRS